MHVFQLLVLTTLSFVSKTNALEINIHARFSSKGSGGWTQPAHPHIIFVLADDLGWHDVGYSGGGIPTPNIDKLAREGVTLTNYYVMPSCAPTRASLMTGLSPMRHGILSPYNNNAPFNLPISRKTLAEALTEVGYEAHLVGKWHLGFWAEEHTPTFKGFKSFYGFYGAMEDYWTHQASTYPPSPVLSGYDFRREETPNCGRNCSVVEDVRGKYGTDLLNRRAAKVVHEHDAQKPLFLFFSWQAVHEPFNNCPDVAKYKGERNPTFACMLMMGDNGLGELVDALTQKSMLKDTLIVFSSDNGGPLPIRHGTMGSSNWPLRGGKHTLLEGGTRSVGFIWTGWASLPGSYNGLMSVYDWFPTLANLASAHVLGDLDGRDQWSAITTGTASPHNHILSGVLPHKKHSGACMGLRSSKWKLIKGTACGCSEDNTGWSDKFGSNVTAAGDVGNLDFAMKRILLFDLSTDEEEKTDLSDQEPETLKHLLAVLESYQVSIPSTVSVSRDAENVSLVKTVVGDTWAPWA